MSHSVGSSPLGGHPRAVRRCKLVRDASGRRSPVLVDGSEFVVKAQTVIPAVSQAADLTFLPVEATFEINRGRVKVDPATYARM